jgi:hypothetical protein
LLVLFSLDFCGALIAVPSIFNRIRFGGFVLKARSDSGSNPDPTRLVLKAYRQMLLCLFLGAMAVTGLLLLLIFVPYIHEHGNSQQADSVFSNSIFLVVILAGTMGAFFSSLQRLYDFKELPQVLYEKDFIDAYGTLFIYSLVPILVGGIAAAVIYLIFAGNLLSGSFFPSFGCSPGEHKCTSFGALLADYAPKDAPEFAKAIFWGFVAGFAERLVPGLLNGFVKSASEASAKSRGDAAKTPGTTDTNASSPRAASRALANQSRVDESV